MTKCTFNSSLIQTNVQKDPNCQLYDVFNPLSCVKCNDRYFMNSLTKKCT